MRNTTQRDRQDIVRDVTEGVLGAGYEWLRRYTGNEEEGILNGAEVHLVWEAPDVCLVELDGEPTVRLRVAVTAEVLEYAEERNEPTGFILTRTWETVPAGWFVKTPKGDWLEVTDTHRSGDRQFVGLRINGHVSHWHRDPEVEVKARRGTLSSAILNDALEAIEGSFKTTIISDEPPGQS